MTEAALQTAIGRLQRDPEFLGKCVVRLDAALAEAKLDLEPREREFLHRAVSDVTSHESARLTAALKEAKEQGIEIRAYMEIQRELALDFARKFSYNTITDATNEMKKAFNATLWMHRVTFYTGIFLIFAAVYAGFTGLNLLASALGLGGLADISYHFYKKPVEGVHRSIGNLVQLEAAFLGFINELGQWKSLGADSDLENNFRVATALRSLTETTMDLIDHYVERIPEELKKERRKQTSTLTPAGHSESSGEPR